MERFFCTRLPLSGGIDAGFGGPKRRCLRMAFSLVKRVMARPWPLRGPGRSLAFPVEILLGPSALQSFCAVIAKLIVRAVEAFAEMMDAITKGPELLGVDLLHLVALRREMQLNPRLGLSCDFLVEFRFGDYARSGPAKLLTHRS